MARAGSVAALWIAALASLMAGSPAVAADSYSFKFSGIHTQDNTQTKAMQRFADLVKDKTGGKVRITIFPNGQLGDEAQLLQAALLPSYRDMATLSTTILTTVDKTVGVTNLPFVFRDEKHVADYELSPVFEQLRDELIKSRGLRMLGAWDSGYINLFTKKPLTQLADLKGLKIRVPPAAEYVRIFQLLGANPTPVPFGELYMSLQTGVVDGTMGAAESVITSKFNEVTKYEIRIDYQVMFFNPVISEKYYQSLPPDIRAALDGAAREVTVWNRAAYHDLDAQVTAQLEKGGMHVIKVNDVDRWRAAVQPMYDDVMKQPAGRLLKLIQDIK